MVLARLFEARKTGFYVDVGAHHPTRFSNTQRFYELGWRGINIEPNPDALALFQRQRSRDTNVCCGVAGSDGRMEYIMFNEPALNSFDRSLSESRQSSKYRIVGTKEVPVRRLSAILEECLPPETPITFMSIDVEGYDLDVLKSNDWTRFRPECLLVESVGFDLGSAAESPINAFLLKNGYKLFAKTVHTLFYLDSHSPG